MDREIVSYKRVVQNNKQLLSMMHRKAKETRTKKITAERLANPYGSKPAKDTASSAPENNEAAASEPESRINAKWTSEELLLGVQGVRTFGKDFHVSDSVGIHNY